MFLKSAYTHSKYISHEIKLTHLLLKLKTINKTLPQYNRSNYMWNLYHTSNKCNDIYQIKDEEDFKLKVMSSKIAVIVNFHAEWCEPCHVLKPLLVKFVEENPGKLHLAEVSVDEQADLLKAFEVAAVPAVVAIKNGQVINKFIGLVSDKEIDTFINEVLENS